MVKALVTGSSGFVGNHLIAHLEERGDDVVTCDRETGNDILDGAALNRYFADTRPEVVYHLAGWADVGGSWSAPVITLRVNAEGTLNVLLAAAEAGVERLLLVSSADVYGKVAESELPLHEASPLRPVSPYAASKVAADFLGVQAWLGSGLPVVRARAFNHLGPGQTDRFVASALASRIAENERTGATDVPVGDLSARRDFTDVRDVVRAYRMLVTDGEAGEAYNVCSGVDMAVQDLADRLLALSDASMELTLDPSRLRPVDVPALRGDPAKIHAATGWTPEIPIDQTLTDLLDQWRNP